MTELSVIPGTLFLNKLQSNLQDKVLLALRDVKIVKILVLARAPNRGISHKQSNKRTCCKALSPK